MAGKTVWNLVWLLACLSIFTLAAAAGAFSALMATVYACVAVGGVTLISLD